MPAVNNQVDRQPADNDESSSVRYHIGNQVINHGKQRATQERVNARRLLLIEARVVGNLGEGCSETCVNTDTAYPVGSESRS